MFALVDCNNFYASCERVFNPALEKKAIVILSNNDGCVIARSNEAKKLKIPMGAPFFAWRHFFEKHRVAIFSSNYVLYGDMSQRVMSALETCCPQLEVYSIDEAFLNLEKFDQIENILMIRQTVQQWTGIPVSIGVAPTKTLAKIANQIAKKSTGTGIFCLNDQSLQEKVLANFPVEEVWGVGRQTVEKLKQMHILTAKDLRDANLKLMRRQFNVVMEKLISELRGISCLPLSQITTKKQIMSSRSFGRPIKQLAELEEAISHYVSLACIKLRNQQSLAQGIWVFIRTSYYHPNNLQYGKGSSSQFIKPTDDTRLIIKTALENLRRIYQPGYSYKKAGIALFGLMPNTLQQLDIFTSTDQKSNSLMKTIDTINKKLGKNSVFIGSEGIGRSWQTIAKLRSPRYTTQWNELVTVYC